MFDCWECITKRDDCMFDSNVRLHSSYVSLQNLHSFYSIKFKDDVREGDAFLISCMALFKCGVLSLLSRIVTINWLIIILLVLHERFCPINSSNIIGKHCSVFLNITCMWKHRSNIYDNMQTSLELKYDPRFLVTTGRFRLTENKDLISDQVSYPAQNFVGLQKEQTMRYMY